MGKPTDNKRTHMVTSWLDDETYFGLMEAADKDERSLSWTINQAVMCYLARATKETP